VTGQAFGATAPWSLGVEEELFLVDRETLDAAPLFSRLVPEPSERLKAELFECFVEITTAVRATADEVLVDLTGLRLEVATRADGLGATILAIGAHPLLRLQGQPIVPDERYERLVEGLGDRFRRQLVCGLHVHVSVPDGQACLRAFEGVLPWLPVLLALSANSPFEEGADTGLRSQRAERLLELPTGGTPPVLTRGWADWEAATRGDDARRHWDVWPRPTYGTLEIRIPDQQTDVRRSAGLAGIVQALVATVGDGAHEPYDRGVYARRRDEAARLPPDRAEVEALAALIEPRARELGGWDLAGEVLAGRPEAERQLALGPAGALREAVERSLVFGR
jgi:carboxylate-amine ligase